MTLADFNSVPPPRLAFGIDRINHVAGDVEKLVGSKARVLLVSDPGVAAAGVTPRVEALLRAGGHEVFVFTGLAGEPTGAQVDLAAGIARREMCQIAIGLGGGSALDTAKFAAAVAVAEAPADFYQLAQNPLPKETLKKICVPTTAGTGSETTRTSVFANGAGVKVWAWGAPLKADLALLDPSLSTGLPAKLTAATGIDALVHAIEACTIKRAHPLNDATGLQAVRMVVDHLPQAVKEPKDLDARGNMLIAAALAGMAIDGSGTGIAHALGHALGTLGHVHHGRAVGLSLRVALAWNAEAAPAAHARVARAMGVHADGRSDKIMAAALAPAFDHFVRKVGLPIGLADHGLAVKDAGRLAEATMSPENAAMRTSNCREVTLGDAERFSRELLGAA